MKHVRRLRKIARPDSVLPFLTANQPIIQPVPPPRQPIAHKAELLADLQAARATILDAARSVSSNRLEQVWLGDWSIRDLLAHLIGWDMALVAAFEDILAGELPSFYHLRDEDWRTLNRQFVQQYNRGKYGELLNAVEDSHSQLLAFLETVPEAEFLENHGVLYESSPVTIGRLLAAEISDENEHYEQLTAWLGTTQGKNADRRG